MIDDEAVTMLEGVLEVADLQVRDIMVPRGQMISVRRDDPPSRLAADRDRVGPLPLPRNG